MYAGQELHTLKEALIVFDKNPYIKDFLLASFSELFADPARAQSLINAKSAVNSALNAVGGLDVTNLAHGFAKFLVKRTKEELNIAFFTKFKEELLKPKYRDLRTVFPQTFRALNAIGDEIYNYQIYIQTLRECFEKDLATILVNLPHVIDNHPEFFKSQPELEAILRSGFYIAKSLQDKKHPGDILADYPEEFLAKSDSNFRAGIATLKVVSKSLRYYDAEGDDETAQYWLNEKQLKLLYADRDLLLLYIGLFQEEVRKAQIIFHAKKTSYPFYLLIAQAHDNITINIPQYERFIRTFAEKGHDVERRLSALKGIKKDSLLVENYYSFFNSTLDLMRHAVTIETLPNFPADLNLRETTEKYFETSQTTCDIVIDINRRNYGSAIVNAHHLLSEIFNGTKANQATLITLEKNLKAAETPQLKFEVESLKDSTSIMSYFYKYGSFMSAVVQAESSDEVAAAIEAFALPPGSSRIKRESSFNVSLNAYVGLFAGFERINKVDDKFKFNTLGLTAPIGVSVSAGRQKFFGCGKGHWSYSLFVSLIDLGAVTAYRFETTASDTASVDQVPTIQLKDIFSPGAFFSIGIPKSPISVNLGAQLGPNLRKITTDTNGLTNKYENSIYWRYSLSILVDIPILNLYTKTR